MLNSMAAFEFTGSNRYYRFKVGMHFRFKLLKPYCYIYICIYTYIYIYILYIYIYIYTYIYIYVYIYVNCKRKNVK